MDNWTIENFMIVGQAMMKMAGFFWPVLFVIAMYTWVEFRREQNEKAKY